MVCLVWAVIFSWDLEQSPCSRWLCWGISPRYIGCSLLVTKWPIPLVRIFWSILVLNYHTPLTLCWAVKTVPTTSSPLLGRKRKEQWPVLLPSNTAAPRERRALPNIGIQNLKTPTSLTRQHFIAHSSLAAPCSPLGPHHPLSTFIREMPTLAVSQRMRASWAVLRDAIGPAGDGCTAGGWPPLPSSPHWCCSVW